MPRELRRRVIMDTAELAPMANTRETEAEEIGPESHPLGAEGSGIDDGFGPPKPPTNGVPRRRPFPDSSTPGKRPLDVNMYATKKTVAQGMMDLALLTANANQLRYVLESARFGVPGVNYYVNLTLISLSIILQLAIGVGLIFIGRYNVTREHHAQKADTINNWVVLGVFFITIINVFISSFSVEPFHGVDPVLLRSVMENKVPPADVTEKVIQGGF